MHERSVTRFLSKVDKNGPIPERRPELGPCWLWKPLGSLNGYGQFTYQGKTRIAHRVAHELFIGPIPDGLTIDHLCNNRACVNPTHLEAVTRAENMRRARCWEGGAAYQREKTHCAAGHPYFGDNLRICKDGKRACRACERRYTAEHRQRRKASQPAQVKPPRTHCVNGHAYAEHGFVKSGKNRCCRACSQAKVRRFRAKQKAAAPPKAPRTTCKYGHPWVEDNLYTTPSTGQKVCRKCHNIRTLTAYHARKAASQRRPSQAD